MQVSLIEFTGKGQPDPGRYAANVLAYAKSTRLTQGEETRAKIEAMTDDEIREELSYIADTIRSSWEFIDYTFEIKGVTRAFTHQLVRTRTASYAQQAQRVADMGDFTAEVPRTVSDNPEAALAWENAMQAIRQAYQQLRAWDIPAQDARGLLPTNVHTNIIVKLNLRTLADLVLKRKNLRVQSEYSSVAALMEACVCKVHPWARGYLNPERLSTPNLDSILAEVLGAASPIDKPRLNAALKELDKVKGIWG